MKKQIVILTRILIFSLSIIILSSTTCKKDNIHYELTIINKSNKSIYMNWADSYPDTLLNCPWGVEIPVNDKYIISGGSHGWEDIFKSMDILQIFIVDANFAKTTPCDSIRKYNMILKRYALTYKDLQNKNWTITYP